ncbi:DNA-deoxyinosine glycosylase [Lacrimispora sp. NSJ-141]|uniref:DNA-deoxyinosine glycosylase n=1 Tax=Lientehia hominis TaxID=2897778 RepID=A0AAP2RJ03_9FIRM|nr:DNA-deoxyinosine glycosylase [Lientehia hominis]MCD2493067.1 DNA-deoxyinosine glycosylase [Lientehia hominis]
MDKVVHEIPPVYDRNSKILILGSFPSVKSREGRFFYHHPQNRFWKVLAAVYGACTCSGNSCEGYVPETVEEKKQFLLENQIAVWDVIASCDIDGSSDSSIKNVVSNDLSVILDAADIQVIFCNGGTSFKLYEKYLEKRTGRQAVKLPSTSPANAAYSLERLTALWREAWLP